MIEGNCVYVSGLESDAGRQLVIWPEGAQWQESLEDREGVRVYPGLVLQTGDAFTAGGGNVSLEGLRALSDQAGYDKALECAANVNSQSGVVVPQQGIRATSD